MQAQRLRGVRWAAAKGSSHSGFFLLRTPRLFGSLDQQTSHFRLGLESHEAGRVQGGRGAHPLQNAAPGSLLALQPSLSRRGRGLLCGPRGWHGLRPSPQAPPSEISDWVRVAEGQGVPWRPRGSGRGKLIDWPCRGLGHR